MNALRWWVGRFRCWLKHDPGKPLTNAEFPLWMRTQLADTSIVEALTSVGAYPIHRCRRCSSLLLWRRTNGGWQAIPPADFAVFLANARLRKMTREINDHLRRRAAEGSDVRLPPLR